MPKFRKDDVKMANRTRTNRNELGRISSSLNQIAKRINSTNHVYQEDMDEVKELMKQVWQSQKSMLSQQPLIKR